MEKETELEFLYQYKIIMILENHYGISINDDESENIVTLNDLSHIVIKKLKDKGIEDLINTIP
jgi:hypothetical protein